MTGEDQKDEEVSYMFGSDRLSSFLAALLLLLFEGLRLGFGIAAAATVVAVDEVDEVDCSAAAAAAVVAVVVGGGIVDAAEELRLLPDVFGVVVCDGL